MCELLFVLPPATEALCPGSGFIKQKCTAPIFAQSPSMAMTNSNIWFISNKIWSWFTVARISHSGNITIVVKRPVQRLLRYCVQAGVDFLILLWTDATTCNIARLCMNLRNLAILRRERGGAVLHPAASRGYLAHGEVKKEEPTPSEVPLKVMQGLGGK